MTSKKTNTKQIRDSEYFAKQTYKEVTLWDWLARVLPLAVLAVVSVFYLFHWDTAIELLLEVSAVTFLIVCFIWWYWAIYKIAVAVKHIRLSQQKFAQLKAEISKMKKDFFKNGAQDIDKHN